MTLNRPSVGRMRIRWGLVVALACLLAPECGLAQERPARRAVSGVDVQRLANGVLGIMSYTVAPDVTTSSLSIANAAIGNPGLTITQLGGGFTWSRTLPLYLEGNAAYARFDPTFVASDGAAQRPVPVKWNALSGTGGVGWDFHLAERWVLRPIFNFMLGKVSSDLQIAKWWLDNRTDPDLTFLDGGGMKMYGLGGALMLDYERFAPEADVDLELRYTNVQLRTFDTPNLDGRAASENLSLWTRRRVPTGWVVWERPVRYVFEGAYTRFLGDQKELGIKHLASLGFGIEFDSSAKDIWVTRGRAVVRYKFGDHVSGWSLGLAVSF